MKKYLLPVLLIAFQLTGLAQSPAPVAGTAPVANKAPVAVFSAAPSAPPAAESAPAPVALPTAAEPQTPVAFIGAAPGAPVLFSAEPKSASASIPNPYPYEPSTDPDDCAACRANLEKIRDAIQAYRHDHKDLPNWLSDLYPQYLPDLAVFICPITTKTGRLSAFGPLDPKLRCSYLYEFSPAPMWAPLKMSIRDWKHQQMSLIGSDVPIVRCLLHEPVQNLSFGGRIYDSGLMWEDNFLDVVTHDQLQPHDSPSVSLTQPVVLKLTGGQ